MSGIAGIVWLDGRDARAEDLDTMVASLAHRAPQGFTLTVSGPAVLAQATTAVTPASPAGRVVAVGDIGLTRGSTADMVSAIESRGIHRTAAGLHGDFAIAAWFPVERRLLCARDHFGVRPLTYRYVAGRFLAFASEPRCLLGLGETPCDLDEDHIRDHLRPRFDDVESTPWRGVRRLPPAHVLDLRTDRLDIARYWELEATRRDLTTPADWFDAIRTRLVEAVRVRLPDEGPVPVSLSGGLDSSTIVGAVRTLGREHRGHALVFPSTAQAEPTSDESEYLDAVGEWTGTAALPVDGDRIAMSDHLALHRGDLAALPYLAISAAVNNSVRGAGSTHLLSGFEGDVTVGSGLEYLDQLAATGDWRAFARIVGQLSQHTPHDQVRLWRRHGRPHLAASLESAGRRSAWVAARLPMGRRDRVRVVATALGGPMVARRLLANGDANATILNSALRADSVTSTASGSSTDPTGAHIRTLGDPVLVYLLERFDEAAARQGVRMRFPFFDRELVELCVSAPPELKLHGGWPRGLLRHATENLVPEPVRWRHTKGTVRLPNRMAAVRSVEAVCAALESERLDPYLDRHLARQAWLRLERTPETATDADLFTVYLAASLDAFLS